MEENTVTQMTGLEQNAAAKPAEPSAASGLEDVIPDASDMIDLADIASDVIGFIADIFD